MKIDFEGRAWQLDIEDISVDQAMTVCDYTGLSLVAWERATLEHESPVWLKSLRSLYWLMLAQNGEDVAISEAKFAVLRFFMAYGEAAAAEARDVAEAAEPDPTKPAGEPAEAAPELPQPTSAG